LKEHHLLFALAVILVAAWFLGFSVFHAVGAVLLLLLVLALVLLRRPFAVARRIHH